MPVKIFTLLALICATVGTIAAADLEGGLTSTSKVWKRAMVPKSALKISAAERAQERAQRKKDLEAQKQRLQERLKRVPDSATMKRVASTLQSIIDNAGWEPKSQHVFSIIDSQRVIDQVDTIKPDLLKAYKVFQADLAKRDIDLIIMAFPSKMSIYGYQYVEGLNASDEIDPGYTKMMLELLENDIEVVDALDAMRSAASQDVIVHWPNDGHIGPKGRQLASAAVADRMQRYAFARAWRAKNRKHIAYEKTSWTGAKTGWSSYLLNARRVGNNKKNPLASTNIPDIMPILKKRPMTGLKMKWNGPGNFDAASHGNYEVVFVGDSQLHTPVFGMGLPSFFHAELGAVCRWGSKSWSGFSLPGIYLETASNRPEQQPRVVVVGHLFGKWPLNPSKKGKYKAKPLPDMQEGPATGAPGTAPFVARVKVTQFSKPKDPNSVDYKEALMQAKAVIVHGPLAGQTVGLIHEVMHKGRLSKSFSKGSTPRGVLNAEHNMRLIPWHIATKQNPSLGTTMLYDDTNLDLTAPIFWVAEGPLSQRRMRSR